MAVVVLFHHVLGRTPGVRELAAALAGEEHTVHTPDLYDGRTFGSVEEGFAHLQTLDRDALARQADDVADGLAGPVVFAGISWGVFFAQRLAQTRPAAAGALLLEACLPVGDDGFGPWPVALPVQVHGMDADEYFAHEGDVDAARALVAQAQDGEVFTYPGGAHLFLDSSLPSSDPAATATVVGRARELLARV
ncbi:dienelactone hydrolase family protein [Pseudokineococcus sp. 1T1Z-3]|uniref:dienelactone hydrolase family protein n=1 Tax=Pseudokineococcus sp. 1T1Z-3 TaxID=3132745 RepID=UPI0030B59B89